MPTLPAFITKFFWGDDPKSLSFAKHSKYISQTILDKGDLKATNWLLNKQSKSQLKKLSTLK